MCYSRRPKTGWHKDYTKETLKNENRERNKRKPKVKLKAKPKEN
jgi:hypothetical protein